MLAVHKCNDIIIEGTPVTYAYSSLFREKDVYIISWWSADFLKITDTYFLVPPLNAADGSQLLILGPIWNRCPVNMY